MFGRNLRHCKYHVLVVQLMVNWHSNVEVTKFDYDEHGIVKMIYLSILINISVFLSYTTILVPWGTSGGALRQKRFTA